MDPPDVRMSARPVVLLAALPLLLIPACWLWWWAGGLNPGVEVGRSSDALLFAGCVAAAWAARTASVPAALLPMLLALAWQAVALLWAPVREPGVVWLVERSAATACAWAIAHWSATAQPSRLIAAGAIAGSGILALTGLTQIGDLGVFLRVHREAPFGNANFAVGAAMPLVALGLTRFLHGGGRGWWLWAIAAAGCAGALAGGWLGGDPCHAVWLGGAAAIASALVLRLPTRWHAAGLAIGAGLLLLALLAPVLGLVDPSGLGAGTAQRVHLWRGALQSLTGGAAVIGHGPAAIIAVLPEQPSTAAAWLTVPSYAAHAHNEALEVLCDGGLVLAGLLGWAAFLTIRPLWRRREEPAVAALLVAWCTAGTQALVESHLSQPGGLLCLAVLAGLSWRIAGEQRDVATPRRLIIAPLLCAVAIAGLIVRELAADGGGPVSIEERSIRRSGGDEASRLDELDRLRARLGPLDNIDLRRARSLGRLGRLEESDAALAAHLRRCPGDVAGLILARRRLAGSHPNPALGAANITARRRAAELLGAVRHNPVNARALDDLARELSRPAGDGPGPVR